MPAHSAVVSIARPDASATHELSERRVGQQSSQSASAREISAQRRALPSTSVADGGAAAVAARGAGSGCAARTRRHWSRPRPNHGRGCAATRAVPHGRHPAAVARTRPTEGWIPARPRAPAAAQQLEQHGLRLVIARVRDGDAVGPERDASTFRSCVSGTARRVFSRHVLVRLSTVDALDRRTAGRVRARVSRQNMLVLVRGSAAQLMIDVRQAGERHAELTLQLVQETYERHRVRAARTRQRPPAIRGSATRGA